MKIAKLNTTPTQSDNNGYLTYYYWVPDNYNFTGNSATDVTSVATLTIFSVVNSFDYVDYRDSLNTLYTGTTFSSFTLSEKQVLVQNLIPTKIERDSIYSTPEILLFGTAAKEKTNVAIATRLSISQSQGYDLVPSSYVILASGNTSALQQAYNNSTTPEILTNGTLGGLSVVNGSGNADNITNIFEGLNTASTKTSFIRADGAFSGLTYYGNGNNLTGLTGISITDKYWISGSTGNKSIRAFNNSGLDATGEYAVAEGYITLASGKASHAEGSGTTASGSFSHSEGYLTKATGDGSHAEGYQTTANTTSTHAEGQGTLASGTYAHAEGQGSIASGATSHAEGQESIAGGSFSHAEGFRTYASGAYSHAEGYESRAIGAMSHAEGVNTTAYNYAHAGGIETLASGDASFVHGSGSTASGTNTIVLGRGITGTSNDTTYVDKLDIKTVILDGVISYPLGVDSNGVVIKLSAITATTISAGTIHSTGVITSASQTAGIGYETGAGSSVTQATNKSTSVTLNRICGRITMNGAALAAAAEVAFTLTNSSIAATDVIIVNIQSVGTVGAYLVGIGAVAAGSCSITLANLSSGSLSQAVVLNFAVIKSVIT